MPFHPVGRQDRDPPAAADSELGEARGDLTGRQQVLGPGDCFPLPLGGALGGAMSHRGAVGDLLAVGNQGVDDGVTLVGRHPDRSSLRCHRVMGRGKGQETCPAIAAIRSVSAASGTQASEGSLPPFRCHHVAPMASNRHPPIAGRRGSVVVAAVRGRGAVGIVPCHHHLDVVEDLRVSRDDTELAVVVHRGARS